MADYNYLSRSGAYGVVYGTLAVLLISTLAIGFNKVGAAAKGADQYLAARDSKGVVALALSFFASGAGAWMLFTVPEASIVGGPIALAGYIVSCLLPLAIFGCVGPYLRAKLPKGCTFADYVQGRYGSIMNVYCTLITLLYLCLYLTAEFSAVGDAVLALSDPAEVYTNGSVNDRGHNIKVGVVLGVACVTVIYTGVGGLPVSLETDKVQGVGILLFTLLVCIASFGENPVDTSDPEEKDRWEDVTTTGTGDASPTGAGDGSYGNAVKMAVILISAVTSANMMHAGFQQRVWAAKDQRKLQLGAIGGMLLTIPLMVLYGAVGMVSYATNGPFVYPRFPSYAAFYELNTLDAGWQVCAVILTVLMVASSADTIQSGVAAVFKPFTTYVLVDDWKLVASTEDAPKIVNAVNFLLAAVVVNVPAIVVSTDEGDAHLSVLSLFVLADLVCATCVVPVLMGLNDRIHPSAAFAGCLVGAFIALLTYALGVDGEPDKFDTLLPEIAGVSGLYATTSLVAFVCAPVGSGLATLIANIPWFVSGYRFAGYPQAAREIATATTIQEVKAEIKADVSAADA